MASDPPTPISAVAEALHKALPEEMAEFVMIRQRARKAVESAVEMWGGRCTVSGIDLAKLAARHAITAYLSATSQGEDERSKAAEAVCEALSAAREFRFSVHEGVISTDAEWNARTALWDAVGDALATWRALSDTRTEEP